MNSGEKWLWICGTLVVLAFFLWMGWLASLDNQVAIQRAIHCTEQSR